MMAVGGPSAVIWTEAVGSLTRALTGLTGLTGVTGRDGWRRASPPAYGRAP